MLCLHNLALTRRVLYDGDAAATSAARIPADEIERHQHDQNDE